MSIQRRCSYCVLSEAVPNITFDEKGVCSNCQKHNKRQLLNTFAKKTELDKIFKEAKDRHLAYDALVPWSGGKDSTFVIYQLAKIYGLKVLAINYHNGFQSETAAKNISNIAENLGVDCIFIKPDWQLLKRIYAAFMRYKGEPCTACNIIGYVLILSFALRESLWMKGCPLIVGGWSSELEAMGGADTFNYSGFKDILANETGLLEVFESHPLIDKKICRYLEAINDPRFTAQYDDMPEIKIIQLPNYMEWNPIEINKILQEKTGYTIPISGQSSHFDCWISPVAQYLFSKEWGFNQYEVTYSEMIRKGQMNREEALKKIQSISNEEPEQMEAFLKKMLLSRSEICRKEKP
jgi:N-acetyl sugar amidotransferase